MRARNLPLVLAALFIPATASAQKEVIVRISVVPGESPSQPSRMFSESLPRNTGFVVEMPATALTQSGLLRVWPAGEEEPDCEGAGGKQSYCLPMNPETVQGRPVLRTAVPQLQSGIPFKFKVEQYDALPPDTAGSLARGVAAIILAPQETTPDTTPAPCSSFQLRDLAAKEGGIRAALETAAKDDPNSREALEKAVATAVTAEMKRRDITGDSALVARLAVDEFFVAVERRNFVQRSAELETKLKALNDAQEKLCFSFELAVKSAFMKSRSPAVFADGKLVQASDFFERRGAAFLQDAPLQAAVAQLAQLSAERRDAAPHEPWKRALESLLALDAAERPAAAAAVDRGALPAEHALHFWDPDKKRLVTAVAAITDFERIKPEVLRAQVESIRHGFAQSELQAVGILLAVLRDLSADLERRNAVRADVAAARTAREQAFLPIRDVLVRSLNSIPVTSAMRTLRKSEGRSDPKLLRTPSSGSFASPDIGAFIAAPLVFRRGENNPRLLGDQPWILPYAGLNLYLEPVERDLPLDQLVEPGGSRWFSRQRWSGTLGFVFRADPQVSGRRTEAPLLQAYPVLGVGYRVTPYLRVTGGAVGYWLLDANSASRRKSAVAAPFIGASIDTDLVSLLVDGLNPKKGK